MTRKQFLRSVLGVGVAALAGCGSDDGGSDATPFTCMTPGVAIGSNHGHVMTVPIAHVNAGGNQMYQIAGAAGHPHTVDLTVEHFTMLKNGTSVTVVSTESGTGHSHSVTVSCA